MTRRLTITVHEHTTSGAEMTDDQYTDLANAIWMFMRSTPFDFDILPDSSADVSAMDHAWEQYGRDASWSG